ncbi:MAG: hypothetical protein V4621_06440 [Pseudomonadota bacterium]
MALALLTPSDFMPIANSEGVQSFHVSLVALKTQMTRITDILDTHHRANRYLADQFDDARAQDRRIYGLSVAFNSNDITAFLKRVYTDNQDVFHDLAAYVHRAECIAHIKHYTREITSPHSLDIWNKVVVPHTSALVQSGLDDDMDGFLLGQESVTEALGQGHGNLIMAIACPVSEKPHIHQRHLSESAQFLTHYCASLIDILQFSCQDRYGDDAVLKDSAADAFHDMRQIIARFGQEISMQTAIKDIPDTLSNVVPFPIKGRQPCASPT